MKDYLVAKVLENRGLHVSSTLVYEAVEIRSASKDLSAETKALEVSMETLRLKIELSLNCRISSVVSAINEDSAIAIADERFEEILDLKSLELPLSKLELTKCGYIKLLNTGEIRPLKDPGHQYDMMFMVPGASFVMLDATQVILSHDTELSTRYRRASHWIRHAKNEKNIQLSIIFYWFSVEALFKETEDDHVGPFIRWFLGFPSGKGAAAVDSNVMSELQINAEYTLMRKKLIDSLEFIREFRNDSVHAGFRKFDFSGKNIDLYEQIMLLGAHRCLYAVEYAIINSIQNVSEFKEYIGLIFNQAIRVDDIHGTVFHALSRASRNDKEETL
ncbi:MAG: hypothetical protein K0U59_02675 [Gammaproteobacteria bacterium]|nr:hypothetical protein [Gammaproteobacteria bacterium]